jgi:hypothetical protein
MFARRVNVVYQHGVHQRSARAGALAAATTATLPDDATGSVK